MLVGVPREIKPQENRVGMVPGSVHEVVRAGASVIVEQGAGLGIGITDDQYRAAGAEIVDTADEISSGSPANTLVKRIRCNCDCL